MVLVVILLLVLFVLAAIAPWCIGAVVIVLGFALIINLLPYDSHRKMKIKSLDARMKRGEITQKEYDEELEMFERWNKK